MIAKRNCPPGTKLVEATYSFLAPAMLRIRRPCGGMSYVGYGIGERITVLEPSVTHLVCTGETLDEVPLADGSAVVWWPADLSVIRA